MIRKARLVDVHVICNLYVELVKELKEPCTVGIERDWHWDKFFLHLCQCIISDDAIVLTATHDTSVVGFLVGRKAFYPYGMEGVVSCDHWFVTELYRNMGLGMKLLEYAWEWAEEVGAQYVELHAQLGRVKVYEELGFKTKHVTMIQPVEGRRTNG